MAFTVSEEQCGYLLIILQIPLRYVFHRRTGGRVANFRFLAMRLFRNE